MPMMDGVAGFGKVDTHPTGARSTIVDAGLRMLAEMRATLGSGVPEPGDEFGRGSMYLRDAGDTVAMAYPREDSWAGAGAKSYASANRRQAGAAVRMSMLDAATATVIARQADQIIDFRHGLAERSDYLASLGRAVRGIAQLPGVSGATTSAVELAAVNAALDASGYELRRLAEQVNANIDELHVIADEYDDMAEDSSHGGDGSPDGARVLGLREGKHAYGPVGELPPDSAPPETAAPSPGQPAVANAAPTEAMAALTPALGAVGGMIGSALAPIAAAVTGVIGAAAQSLSALPMAADLAGGLPTDRADSAGAEDASKRRPADSATTDQDEVAPAEDEEPADANAETSRAPRLSTPPTGPEIPPAPIRPPQNPAGANP